ncbi:MAG: beta-ketoacyl-[acyl-carrier-protein] synthase family protein [Desulfobacterales bacterium]|jgi:3-oxoacyl-[acyl-carrier-protein] synthase II|nr:beta-ketoacyl-[acyl-carrier-protein] synthase family protein [Desulfobacterales bacterium]
MKKRVVITGLGAICAIGGSVTRFRDGLFSGKCGIGPVSLFETMGFQSRVAAQVKDEFFDHPFLPGETKRASRCDRLGLIAAKEAVSDAGIGVNLEPRNDIGVLLGGGAGGMFSWEQFRRAQWAGKTKPRPSLVLASSPGTLSDLIAQRYHFTGIRGTFSTACSSSGTAIGYAADLIRIGKLSMAITGGSEALSEVTFAGFNALHVTDPEHCKPFDQHRRGISLGEGSAMLVLEDYEHARNRRAKIYAEVLGYAINSDAYHMTSPDPEGRGMAKVMARALQVSGVKSDQVDYINAHGTGTPINDKVETAAIKHVFGDHARRLAVSSTKSMVGHCLGASGAIEALATVLALHEQIVPPTIHLSTPDPECDLDYVPETARNRQIHIALSNSFAFGGNNTALVLGQVAG